LVATLPVVASDISRQFEMQIQFRERTDSILQQRTGPSSEKQSELTNDIPQQFGRPPVRKMRKIYWNNDSPVYDKRIDGNAFTRAHGQQG
jgi:hypothetical protein